MPPIINFERVLPPFMPPIQTLEVEGVSVLSTLRVATGGMIFHYFLEKSNTYAKVVEKRATRCHLPPNHVRKANEVYQ